jgi:hypothetical protein
MVRNNHLKIDKVTLVSWVDKTLDQSLSKQNILSGFRATRIWPLNPRAMDDKTRFSNLYIIKKGNNHLNKDIGNIDDVGNDNPQWGKDVVAIEFMSKKPKCYKCKKLKS